MNVCTIIAKNYVAQARVLARSFAEHHPDGRVWTLIIDDYDGFIDPASEPFEVLSPADVGCDEFEEMAFRYTVLELATAVKPWLLRHLMVLTGLPVTYLDPDIKVYGSLQRLDELAAAHGVVLVPHSEEPIPDDGRRPSQFDILRCGVYNLGYLSIAPTPDVWPLLDWWADRLRRDCRIALDEGYFVDQRWFDLAPGFLPGVEIVRDPEFNVAYWNLHTRSLDHDGGRYLVNGRPLAFFHFSGFNPELPTELSIFQDRLSLRDDPVLERISREYVEDVYGAGFAVAGTWSYGFASLPGGVPIDAVLRKLYGIAEGDGEIHGSPLSVEGGRSFVEWLGAQQPGAPAGVNRLLAHVYGTRPDLQAAFADLSGSDLGRLLAWSQGPGKDEVPALGHLGLPDGAEQALNEAQRPRRRRGLGLRRRLRQVRLGDTRPPGKEFDDLQRHWNAFGEADPLWAILSAPGKRGGGWDPEEFFATGETDVTAVLSVLSERGVAVDRGRALDFGCGVGRLTQALAGHFDRCDGVDLAPSMIERARALNNDSDRVRFHHNEAADLRLFDDSSFDFVLALLVLQHMRPGLMREYLSEFVRVLRPGGVAYFNIPERIALGEGLPADAWRATVSLRDDVPALVAGRIGQVEVSVRNDSRARWPASALLYVGDRWRSPDGALLEFEGSRTLIDADVGPAHERAVAVEVAAPGTPGDYVLEFDIVQDFVGWFGDRGSGTLRVPVHVAYPGETTENGDAQARSTEPPHEAFRATIEMHALERREVRAALGPGATVVAEIPADRCGPSYPSVDYIVIRSGRP